MGSDPLYSDEWLDRLSSNIPVECVIVQDGFLSVKRVLQFIFMMELKDIYWLFKKILKKLVFQKSIKNICNKKNIRYLKINSVNTPNFINQIDKNKVNLLISFNGVEIWAKQLLETPLLGCINIHLGKLPFFKGLSPVVHSINSKGGEATVSIHWMTEKIDAGRVISEKNFKLKNTDTIIKLHDLLNMTSVDLISNAFKIINQKKSSHNLNTPDSIKVYKAAKISEIIKAKKYLRNI